LSIACFITKTVATESRSSRKTIKLYSFQCPNFGRDASKFFTVFVSAIYLHWFGKVCLSSFVKLYAQSLAMPQKCRILQMVGKNSGPIFGGPLSFAMIVPNCLYNVSFRRYSPFNWPLIAKSSTNVENRWFWGHDF